MRLPADRRFARITFTLTALALAVGGTAALARKATATPALAAPVNGPQSDYPLVVGAAYSVAGVAFNPEDVMNYDQVGYLAADTGAAISAAHHTLPLPSYVEVTSLVTGRTILVRVDRRGPMNGTELLGLSPGALAQLDATAGSPVRVRRVNPPEDQRAILRAGQPAPLRMDTPLSLVEVLKRKLPGQTPSAFAIAPPSAAGVSPVSATPTAVAVAPAKKQPSVPAVALAKPGPVVSPRRPEPASTAASAASGVPAKPSAATTPSARFAVQVAAFASAENAHKAAGSLGGQVAPSGKLFRVRTGPFRTRGEAQASLAKVRAAGYSDARIQTTG